MFAGILSFLKSIGGVILALPKIIDAIKALLSHFRSAEKAHNEERNEKIRKDVENAETTEQKQNALNDAAGRFGGK